jgi:hypothetical protein
MTRNRDLGDVAPFVDGVSSNIQTQINAKQGTISVTADRALISDGSGALAVSTVTSTQLATVPNLAPIANPTFTGTVNVSAQGSVRMEDAAGGEYAAFQAPTTLTASYIMTMPPNTGSAGQFLQTNGSGVLSFSGVGSSTNVITSNTTATKDNHYYVNGSAITLTLPASPSVGDEVRFSEIAGNTNNVIARNSSNIMSSATDLTVDTAFAVLYLRYVDATIGWALS